MSTVTVENEAPWRAGFRSARANLLPGLVLQGLALALVLSYYRNNDAKLLLDRLAAWRQEVGVGFAIVSTGLFGGLLPVLYLRAWPVTRGTYTWAQGAMITAFWCYKGFEVDLVYRSVARLFGSGHDMATVASKTVFDQFIYCPLFAVPVTVLVYQWTAEHFQVGVVVRDMRAGGWFRRKIVPLLISNMWVWLPTVCIIYSLPTGLQLPLQNLVLCFFTLLVAHQMKRAV